MKVPILKKSLCGCSLRTGSFCVAYIYLLSCLLFSAFYTYMACTSVSWYLQTLYAEIISVVLQVAATIFLLVGLYKKNRDHISKWIWISIVIGIIILLKLLELLYHTIFHFDEVTVFIAIILAMVIGMKIYALLIVYNYSKELSQIPEKHVEYIKGEVRLV